MTSIATGSCRAWLELGTPDVWGNIALTFGFFAGLTVIADVYSRQTRF